MGTLTEELFNADKETSTRVEMADVGVSKIFILARTFVCATILTYSFYRPKQFMRELIQLMKTNTTVTTRVFTSLLRSSVKMPYWLSLRRWSRCLTSICVRTKIYALLTTMRSSGRRSSERSMSCTFARRTSISFRRIKTYRKRSIWSLLEIQIRKLPLRVAWHRVVSTNGMTILLKIQKLLHHSPVAQPMASRRSKAILAEFRD